MKKTLFYIFFLCVFSFSFGQKGKYILEGNIGKSPIIFILDDYGNNDLGAIYFYKSTLRDIRLEYEKVDNDNFIFSFTDSYMKYKEKFILKRKSVTTFDGIWKDSKNNELPVSLHKADLSKVDNPFLDSDYIQKLKKESPENFIRSSFLVFKKDSIFNYNGHKSDWYSEKFSKTSFMRISRFEHSEAKNLINKKLFDLHLEMAINQLSCSNYSTYNDSEGIDYSTKISYWDSNLLGFSNFSSYFCGGAHPDFTSRGYLFDLHNGQEYKLDDIIAFDKSATTEIKTNFTTFSTYRSNFFAPALTKLMIKQYNLKKTDDNEEDPCDYTNVEYWTFPSWIYTKEGIVFIPEFYRAARSCEDSFLLPFKILIPYKNKDFKYQLK